MNVRLITGWPLVPITYADWKTVGRNSTSHHHHQCEYSCLKLTHQFTLSRLISRAHFGPPNSPGKVVGICRNDRIPGLIGSPTPILPPYQLQTDRQCPRTTTMRNPGLRKLTLLTSPWQESLTSPDCLYAAAMSCSSLGEWYLPCFIQRQPDPWVFSGGTALLEPVIKPSLVLYVDCTIQFTKNSHNP